MNKQQIVVNTIAFSEQMQRQVEQLTFFAEIALLGIQYVEVRQEYFLRQEEYVLTAREAEKYGLKLLYSVPKQLFQNGRLDRRMIEETVREAQELSAIAVKWTRGDFKGWHLQDLDWMVEMTQSFQGVLTVENDQTEQDGTLFNYREFLKECREVNVPLYSTFDIGNWKWVLEDPLQSARELSSYVKYIHIKDVVVKPEGPPEAVPLGQGELFLKEILKQLPENLLVALEYPCGNHPFDLLREGINWLERLGL